MGYMISGGKPADLFLSSPIILIGSFVVGSIVLSFGYLQPFRVVIDAFRGTRNGEFANCGTNVLVCECASRASLFGAGITFLLGFINAVSSFGGDMSGVGWHIGEATVAPIFGVFLSTFVCKGLKHRFLSLPSDPYGASEPVTAKDVIIHFFYLIVGFSIAVALTGLYMHKITTYLESVLQR